MFKYDQEIEYYSTGFDLPLFFFFVSAYLYVLYCILSIYFCCLVVLHSFML